MSPDLELNVQVGGGMSVNSNVRLSDLHTVPEKLPVLFSTVPILAIAIGLKIV